MVFSARSLLASPLRLIELELSSCSPSGSAFLQFCAVSSATFVSACMTSRAASYNGAAASITFDAMLSNPLSQLERRQDVSMKFAISGIF